MQSLSPSSPPTLSYASKLRQTRDDDTCSTTSSNDGEQLPVGWVIMEGTRNCPTSKMIELLPAKKRALLPTAASRCRTISPEWAAVNAICDLHRMRRARYLRLYGVDAYNHVFMFPNYDYYYFDHNRAEQTGSARRLNMTAIANIAKPICRTMQIILCDSDTSVFCPSCVRHTWLQIYMC